MIIRFVEKEGTDDSDGGYFGKEIEQIAIRNMMLTDTRIVYDLSVFFRFYDSLFRVFLKLFAYRRFVVQMRFV